MASDKCTFMVFLGAPGSGKGTQARMLGEKLGIPHISTGDLFRYNLKNGTKLGLLAKTFIDRGELVPDEVTVDMVEDRLALPGCDGGAIFDGFPRNLAQAVALETMLAADGGVSLVPLLDVCDDEVMRRITGRRVCRSCGAVYHVDFSPPKMEDVCDLDGGDLYHRDDDKPETVKNRLFVYYKQTSPLIGYYFAKGLLVQIDGMQAPEVVQTALVRLCRERGIGSGAWTVADLIQA